MISVNVDGSLGNFPSATAIAAGISFAASAFSPSRLRSSAAIALEESAACSLMSFSTCYTCFFVKCQADFQLHVGQGCLRRSERDLMLFLRQ